MSEAAQPVPDGKSKSSAAWKIQFYALCGMLLLALIGMGLSQALQKGSWWYWLFIVVVYAILSLWRSTSKAKKKDKPIRSLISRELGHWVILLAFLGVIFLLEQKEIISRDASSDIALLLLALSCCLAGVHFDWLMLLVGIFLTVMVVAMATLDQYSIVLWVIMILMAVGAAAFYYFKSTSGGSSSESFE
jgi:hypothetical protein